MQTYGGRGSAGMENLDSIAARNMADIQYYTNDHGMMEQKS